MEQNIFLQEYFKIIQYLYLYLLSRAAILHQLLSIIIQYQTKVLVDSCLIKSNISVPKNVINLYISYTLTPQLGDSNTDFTLNNCLVGSVKLTKNADPDKYKYGGYGVGFDSCSELSFTDGSIEGNVIMFGADISSFVHVDHKDKDILILGEGPTQGLHDMTLTAESKYHFNFTRPNERFVLSLYYNGINSFLFINATKVYQFKAKDSEIKDYTLCLGNISKDFTINNMKTLGLRRVVKFCVC